MKSLDTLNKELKQLKNKVNKLENELHDLKRKELHPVLTECEDSN